MCHELRKFENLKSSAWMYTKVLNATEKWDYMCLQVLLLIYLNFLVFLPWTLIVLKDNKSYFKIIYSWIYLCNNHLLSTV